MTLGDELDKELERIFGTPVWDNKGNRAYLNWENMNEVLEKQKDKFDALNQNLFDKAHWISRKDYYYLYELMGEFKLYKTRCSWEIVIEYSDGRIIGHHYANGDLEDHILNILKNGILCEKGSDKIKDSILQFKESHDLSVLLFRNVYNSMIRKEISKYIKTISVQTTELVWHICCTSGILDSTYFLHNYDNPFFLSIENKYLPSFLEEFVGIPITKKHLMDSLMMRISMKQIEEEEEKRKAEDQYDNDYLDDDDDFYAREAFYYLTGGQAGDYEDHYPKGNPDDCY